jgi:hypothetical protein
MWRGDPAVTLRCTALFENGSTELDDFLAQTEGTCVITVPGATDHKLDLTLHRTVPQTPNINDQDGLVAITMEYAVLEHSSNGVLTWDAYCTKDEIGTAA